MSAFLIVIPAKAGTQLSALHTAKFVSIVKWIPAFAGMTE
jgi:hypothetical protein